MTESEFDYIVVGAGSAGCVIASRLSEDENCRVCLIEGGVSDDTSRVQIPSGLLTLQRSEYYSYQYKSVPQGHLNDREIPSPRGRVLGGSSSMNSMVYIRGHASDYDMGSDGLRRMGVQGRSTVLQILRA